MISHCHGWHSIFHGTCREFTAPYGAVEKAVFCMDMKMDELSGHYRNSLGSIL